MSRKDRYKKKMKAQGQPQSQTMDVHAKSQTSALKGSYVITSRKMMNPWMVGKPKEVRELVDRLCMLSQESPRQAIPQLLEAISRFPDIPSFHNYLSIAYSLIGDYRNAELTVFNSYELFPDYLFAKMNYINYLIEGRQLKEVAAIFNGKFTIGEHYPDRTEFHLTEVTAFNYASGAYLAQTGRHAEARELYQTLLSIAPHDTLTRELKRALERARSFDDVETEHPRPPQLNSQTRSSLVKGLLAKLLGRL